MTASPSVILQVAMQCNCNILVGYMITQLCNRLIGYPIIFGHLPHIIWTFAPTVGQLSQLNRL